MEGMRMMGMMGNSTVLARPSVMVIWWRAIMKDVALSGFIGSALGYCKSQKGGGFALNVRSYLLVSLSLRDKHCPEYLFAPWYPVVPTMEE